ncbi:MAG: transporter related [Bryobacterales bacterium]|nr:transporter related [Bryobacterales bacterium]
MSDWLRLLGYARRYTLILVFSVILMAVVGASQASVAVLIRPVIDRVLQHGAPDVPVPLFTIPLLNYPVFLNDLVPAGIHNEWTMVAFAIVTVFAAKGLADYLANYFISRAGFSATTDLRNAVFSKVLGHGAAFFESNTTGRVMSSVMNDIDKIQVAVSTMLVDFLRQLFMAVFLLLVVMQTNWKLALFSLTVLPIVLIPTARMGRRIRRTSRHTQENVGELNQILQETISGHTVVHAFGAEAYEMGRFQAAARRLLKTNLRYVLQQALASPLIEICGALTIVALLTFARSEIKTGGMTAGQFMSFLTAMLMLYEPVKRLTGIHNIFQQAIGASQKVFEYLDHADDIQDRPGAVRLEGFSRALRFEDISFRYPSTENYQLRGINLEVRTGEVVALVGPSGAGKTTLANLVPRFHDVFSGAVTLDGRDIRDFTLASLREKIGIVAQDTFLFNDTIANNIAYGRSDIELSKVRDAARHALADEFIERLPGRYSTLIGERGVRLSGGQRQRLAIARAMLKNAPILILDEATSHLDTESEMLVQRALANLMVDRTVIVIAHRISTIRRANRIVVLDNGRIAETGTHDELIKHGGIYQRLHELQFMTVASGIDL